MATLYHLPAPNVPSMLSFASPLICAKMIVLTVDTSMGTVGAPAHLGSPVNLDVVDHEAVDIQTLVVSIALSVTKQLPQELGALLGPAALSAAKSLSLQDTPTKVTLEMHNMQTLTPQFTMLQQHHVAKHIPNQGSNL